MRNTLDRVADLVRKTRDPETSDAMVRAVGDGAKALWRECITVGGPVPVAAREPAPPPRQQLSARQAAVRLVTFVEARARTGGLVTAMGAAGMADHAITVSIEGINFCTVCALDGEIYVDPAGPAPLHALPLRYDTLTEMFWPTNEEEVLDPCAFIERAIAAHAPSPRAVQLILSIGRSM